MHTKQHHSSISSFRRFFLVFLFVIFFGLGYGARAEAATYYVDATSGVDSNTGTLVGTPWQTVSKVNTTVFSPGDSILFKRGETWIGDPTTLRPSASGTSGLPITYGAYGTGAKPIITTAVSLGDSAGWTDTGGNIWATNAGSILGSELVSNGGFETNTAGWYTWCNSAHGGSCTLSRTTVAGEYDAGAAGAKVTITNSGTGFSDGQLGMDSGMAIQSGTWYALTFRAKASSAFTLSGSSGVTLENGQNSFDNTVTPPAITTSWTTITRYYHANTTISNTNIIFYFGINAPAGSTLYVDTVSLKPVTGQILGTDVGNLIMNNSTVFGVKKWTSGALSSQGDYWYDITNHLVKMYSTSNPGTYYSGGLKAVLNLTAIDFSSRSYLVFDGLHTSMTNMGFDGDSADHVVIQNCDISYIGGGDFYMDGVQTERFGNGIQLWDAGHDITVQNNTVWQVYDAALTTQGKSGAKYNQYFLNNVVRDSEYGIEYWNNGGTSDDIRFESNTLVDSGSGWGHNQRPDGMSGRAFMFFGDTGTSSNVSFQNNSAVDATQSTIKVWSATTFPRIAPLVFDYNYYANAQGGFYNQQNPTLNYSTSQFAQWQALFGKDMNSYMDMGTAKFVDRAHLDYRPAYDSAMIDRGTMTGFTRNTDILNHPIYGTPDIGAYEYQPPHTVGTDKVDTSAGARIYRDGKFRDLTATSGTTADLSIAPQTGSFPTYNATDTRPEWMDISGITWNNTGTHHKQWTESSDTIGSASTLHTVGDLEANKFYTVSVDSIQGASITGASGTTCIAGTCQSNTQGKISFIYSGGYSTHTFDVVETTDALPPAAPSGLSVF